MTQQNAALVEEASAASQSMAGQAKALHQMMEPYQVTAEAANNVAAIAAAAETLRLASAGPVGAPANAERRATGRPSSASETKTAPPARNRPLKTAAANGNDSEWKEFDRERPGRHQTPVFGMLVQGSAGASAPPLQQLDGNIVRRAHESHAVPSRGGRLIVTPCFISRSHAA